VWGLGWGVLAQPPTPQSPIPNPQSPRSSSVILNFKLNCFNKIINYNNIKYSNLIYSENDENWGKFSISNAIQNDYLILLVPPYIIIN
jgi:hypothetical protein